MKLSTATVLSALALSQRPGGVASQGIKASFPLLLFGKVAAINFVEEQPGPLFQLHDADADAAAADLDQDQGIDIDDFKEHVVDVEPNVRWNLESNSAAIMDRRLGKKRERKVKGGKTTKSEKPKSEKTNPIPGPDDPVICSGSCLEYLQKSLVQLEDLVEPEDYERAAEMLTEAFYSIGEEDFLDYAEELEEDQKKYSGEVEIQSACDTALLNLASSSIGVFLSLINVPSRATERVTRAIIRQVFNARFKQTLKDIAKDYWGTDNIGRVTLGFLKLIAAISAVLNPVRLMSVIISNLSFWDGAQFAIIGAAQIAATYATGGAALAVRLALVGPPLVRVVRDAVAVGNNC